jgi:hypothetical protein
MVRSAERASRTMQARLSPVAILRDVAKRPLLRMRTWVRGLYTT